MTLYRSVYFATLSGSIAGLAAWAISNLILVGFGVTSALWVSDAISVWILSIFIGIFIFLHADLTTIRRVRLHSVGWGLLLGSVTAVAAAALIAFLRIRVQGNAPTLYRLLAWVLAGSAIGLGVGARWARSNRIRLMHAYLGGLAGSLLGGCIFTFLGPQSPELCQACGFLFIGAGTGFGSALSPFLIREGTVEFISSGDARAQSKLGRKGKRWPLELGERYIIGNRIGSDAGSNSTTGVDIFVPDATLASQHAVIFSKDGRYFLARHPDAGGQGGLAKFVLRVHGKTVTSTQELIDADDIVVGKTCLRFSTKKTHDE